MMKREYLLLVIIIPFRLKLYLFIIVFYLNIYYQFIVRTESYGLPDTKMTLAESEVRTSDFDLSSKKKFGKKIMLQKVKNKPMTIRLPKPMDTNTDYRRRIDSIRMYITVNYMQVTFLP